MTSGPPVVALLLLAACGGDEPPGADRRDAGSDGGVTGCGAGVPLLPDGACGVAGVPPEACAQGFSADGTAGCVAILPAEPCAPGLIAVPGDVECRAVAPCGAPPWGDIPVDATTQFVDVMYAGGGNDGTKDKPWTTIQEGVDAAGDGGLVAIAAGTYDEDVAPKSKSLRLWGRCPEMVELAGTGATNWALLITSGGAPEVHTLSVRGPAVGVGLSGSEDMLLDRVWIHDTGDLALDIEDAFGPTRVTLKESLLELATNAAVFAASSAVTIEGSAIRDTQLEGRAISAQPGENPADRSAVTVRGSLLERNRNVAVFSAASDVTLEATVVRQTQPGAGAKYGVGVGVYGTSEGGRSTFTMRASVVDANQVVGIYASGSDVVVEDSVVRGTLPQSSDQTAGRGIDAEDDAALAQPSSLVLRSSLVADNHEIGVYVGGSGASIEATIVRGTQPQASDGRYGRGINVQYASPSDVAIRASTVEQSHEVGVFLAAGTFTLDRVLVRRTEATMSDGTFGDSVSLAFEADPTTLVITGSRLEASARAGVSSFGATVTIDATQLECNLIDLDGEMYMSRAADFQDLGGNVCGCDGAGATCVVLSASLEPPSPLGGSTPP